MFWATYYFLSYIYYFLLSNDPDNSKIDKGSVKMYHIQWDANRMFNLFTSYSERTDSERTDSESDKKGVPPRPAALPLADISTHVTKAYGTVSKIPGIAEDLVIKFEGIGSGQQPPSMAICTMMVRGRQASSQFARFWYFNSYRRKVKKMEFFNRVYTLEKGTVIVPTSQCRRDETWVEGSDIPSRVVFASEDLTEEASFFASQK